MPLKDNSINMLIFNTFYDFTSEQKKKMSEIPRYAVTHRGLYSRRIEATDASPHYSWPLLLQPPIRRCDRLGCRFPHSSGPAHRLVGVHVM